MVSKKSPSSAAAPPVPQPAALPMDSMPTQTARSLDSPEEEATLVYASTKGAAGRLQVEEGSHAGEEVLLSVEPCVMGRSSECALVLRRSAGISRKHAQVSVESGMFYLEDLGSRNGTKLNGKRISGRVPLQDGDRIGISGEQIRFIGPPMLQHRDPAAPPLPQSPASQVTAMVEQPALQALLAASAQGDGPAENRDEGFSQAATARSSSARPSPPAPSEAAAPPQLEEDFGPGLHTTTDAASADGTHSGANAAANRARSKPEPTEKRALREAASVPPTAAAAPAQPPVPQAKRSSLGLPVALIALCLVLGVLAYDLALNEGALLDSWIGEAPRANGSGPGIESSRADATGTVANEAEGKPEARDVPEASPPAGITSPPSNTNAPTTTTAQPSVTIKPAPEAAPNMAKAGTNVPAAAPQPSAPVSTATSSGGQISVQAGVGGVVSGVTVQIGAKVSAQQVLMHVNRLPAAQARKKRALMREEKLFAPLAAKGDQRAAKDLAAVRKELREVEGSRKRQSVLAPKAGTVTEVLVRSGQSVEAETRVVTIRPD